MIPHRPLESRCKTYHLGLDQSGFDKKTLDAMGVKSDEINRATLRFLEASANLWPVVRERNTALASGDMAAVKRCNVREGKIIERMKFFLEKVARIRVYYRYMYQQNAKWRAKEDELCREDVVHWVNYWAYTYDPRMVELGLSPFLPFVLWPAQELFVRGVEECFRNKVNWLGEKSRGVGMTWMLAALYVHHWRYMPGFVGKFGSRKEDLVDRTGDPDTLFWKLRHLIYHMPVQMRPEGYEKKNNPHDNRMRLVNPDNNSVLIGEGGENIGAGGRSSMVVVDEKALCEQQETIDRALSLNTNCQGDISTPRGMNHFGKKRHSGSPAMRIFTVWWWQDPSKNPKWLEGKRPVQNPWYEYQVEKFGFDKVLVAQELDINYNASVEGVFIEPEWVLAAVDFSLPAEGDRVAGFDVAGGGKNDSVYALRVGPVVMPLMTMKYRSETEATWQVVDRGEEDRITLLNYDADGIGHTVLGLLKNSERPIKFRVNAIHGNSPASSDMIEEEGRTGKEKFRNKRAEMWWNVRTRCRKTFEHRNGIRLYPASELISLPNDEALISELTAPKQEHTTGGKIMVESKKSMRNRGVDSPDRADAVVYAMADYSAKDHVVDTFDYTDKSTHVSEFNVDLERPGGNQYCVLVQTRDFTTHGIACLWWPGRQKLQVYSEFVIPNARAKEVVRLARDIMTPAVKPIKEWVANDDMFEGANDGRHAPWFEYRREKVSLHRNYNNDYRGAIMLVNRMFAADMIQVHKDCERLVYQLANWVKQGAHDDSMGLAMCLCQIVTRLRIKRMLKVDRLKTILPYKGEARFASTAEEGDAPLQDFMDAKREREYGIRQD